MSVIGNPLLLTPEGYQISRSVRLRSSASAYFNRTPASAGNRKTWTWSGWVKRGALGSSSIQSLFSAGAAGSYPLVTLFWFYDYIDFYADVAGTGTRIRTNAIYRDPSAWYHVIAVLDTTQATAGDRMKLYVNGLQVTSLSTSNPPAQNADLSVNNTVPHFHAAYAYDTATNRFDGYMTEVNFIDGQALTPSSFGETDAVTGVWKPKKYAGTYGTNGFYLNFSDPSAATAAAIGKDYSGNGNNWTPNNISVTAGVTYDSMIDVPTPYADGGNGRGNYAVLNQLGNSASGTLSEANLRYSRTFAYIQANIPVSTGQWYWEVTLNALGSAGLELGILGQLLNGSNTIGTSTVGYGYDPKLGRRWVASVVTTGQTTSTVNDVIGFAFDASALTLQVFKNNASLFTITGITAGEYYATCNGAGTGGVDTVTFNFGQRPFAYTPPTGFKALNTQNLPEPTIKKGNLFFDATTYTGNGSTRTVTLSGGLNPDLIWIKNRGRANSHVLADDLRGYTNMLSSDRTDAESAFFGTGQYIQNVVDGSFQVYTPNAGFGEINYTNDPYVAWTWKANGAGVTNTAGSITSTVSAGVTQGFSVVTYTGTGANATVGHGLGVAPAMVIVKRRDGGANNWRVYHKNAAASPATGTLYLSLTSAFTVDATEWNNTAPTSSVFSLGTQNSVNGSGGTFVAYCFAEVPGFSRFGSYTGNGSTDGPFVFCGFRPRWVMIKRTDAAGEPWAIIDTARDTVNASGYQLKPNAADAEDDFRASFPIDLTANGFKLRNSGTRTNANGGTYIFLAFAEHPFKNALAR